MPRVLLGLALLSLLGLGYLTNVAAQDYEVWSVDQADAEKGGDRLYIYRPDGEGLRLVEVVALGERAAGRGDGAGVRPHLLLFNSTHTHGILANVASGHVYIIRGSDRTIVASIDVGTQAHSAMASPDDRWILVANQAGKRVARIQADFVNEVFTYQPQADLDLAAIEDADHPDNAPICPFLYVGAAGKAYVTVRGGGMYVIDALATPMRVMRSFSKDEVVANGCGGVAIGSHVYLTSGAATSGHIYVFDAGTDDLLMSFDTTALGTDLHGAVVVNNRYIWAANRGDGDNIVIFDARTKQIVGTIEGVGAAPDLADISPTGDRVFVTLRGPKALTGGPPAIGETPGLAVLAVEQGGAAGRLVAFIPIGPQTPDSDADPHAIGVRWP